VIAPEIACVVLSLADEATLVAAVRSVLDEGEPVEVVVVNSGGGDPDARLRAAGIDVPVIDRPERLFPGAVRNLGIAATRAPYVSFLAADCLARPGWLAGRLREHRAGAAAVASCPANAYPASVSAWASLLLLHNRLLPVGSRDSRLYYGLSYERGLFERFGLFDETLRAGEDTEFNARIRSSVTLIRANDVETAHRYPTSVRAFLADAHRRGLLAATTLGHIHDTRPQGIRVACRAAMNVIASLRRAWLVPRPARLAVLRAWPLVPLGGAAFAAGALTAYVRPYDDQGESHQVEERS
jgi:glycosyltransferase involved in cell wall biosynthesis